MPHLVRRYDNKNQPIVFPKKGLLASTYFNLVRLKKGEEYQAQIAGIETLIGNILDDAALALARALRPSHTAAWS